MSIGIAQFRHPLSRKPPCRLRESRPRRRLLSTPTTLPALRINQTTTATLEWLRRATLLPTMVTQWSQTIFNVLLALQALRALPLLLLYLSLFLPLFLPMRQVKHHLLHTKVHTLEARRSHQLARRFRLLHPFALPTILKFSLRLDLQRRNRHQRLPSKLHKAVSRVQLGTQPTLKNYDKPLGRSVVVVSRQFPTSAMLLLSPPARFARQHRYKSSQESWPGIL